MGHTDFCQKSERPASKMKTADFIKKIRETAAVLEPLTQSVPAGAAAWNGSEYVKGEAKSADPQALAWWAMLGAIANLLEAQNSPLSSEQVAYLEKTLFGGAGSLNDLFFDSRVWSGAASVNSSLAGC